MKAYVDSVVWLPTKGIHDLPALKDSLTVSYFQLGETEPVVVEAFIEDGHYIAVPRDHGLQLIAKYGFSRVDRTSRGEAVAFPREVEHTGDYAYQDAVVKRMLALADTHMDFMMDAMTGKGKTVMSLSVAQKRGRATLVIVDQENLMQQWIDQCKNVLGLPDSRIGRIQGDVCSYKGKAVVVAMVHSLVQREYEDAMYEYFGTVIFDEVHTIGAPTFSRSLMMFSAEFRFGVSATIRRDDSLQKLLHWNLGAVEVELRDKHAKSYLYYVTHDTVYSWYANISPKAGRMLLEVSEDTARNAMIAEIVLWSHQEGRQALIIGDRIEQLEALMAMCYYAGVPEEGMALYTGMRNVYAYAKDPTPKSRPVGYASGTRYSPVILTAKRKKIPKAALEKAKDSARQLFATFGMFSKGVDAPRLDFGIDTTPRSKATQTHGRILRVAKNKLVPIWVTIRDTESYRLEYQFLQRLNHYVEDSAEIYRWRIGKGVRLADVRALKRSVRRRIADLKEMNIITLDDKRNMLQTPTTPSA